MITWRDTEDIAIALSEGHPELDPLTVRFTDLHKWVTELPGFTDDPKASNERSSRRSRWPGSTSTGIDERRPARRRTTR